MSINAANINFGSRNIMLTTDLDGTFLKPAPDNMQKSVEDRVYDKNSVAKTIDAVQKNNINRVMINTGRNFSEIKEVEGILRGSNLPVEAIALEDGKKLLKKPKQLTPQQWMAQLFNKDINYMKFADKYWTQKNQEPLNAIGDFLINEMDFIHRKDNGENIIYSKPVEIKDAGVNHIESNARWEITIMPPAISAKLNLKNDSLQDDIDAEKFSKELSTKIDAILHKKGYKIKHPSTKKEISYITTFERYDVNKGTAADYVRQGFDDETLEIRAGDSYNDESMLKTSHPDVYTIQVGDDKKLRAALAHKDNNINVAAGELGKGINLVCENLLNF